MIRKQTSLARGQTSLRHGQTSVSSLAKGVRVPTPPAGFALRLTSDGQYVQDNSGNYEIVRVA